MTWACESASSGPPQKKTSQPRTATSHLITAAQRSVGQCFSRLVERIARKTRDRLAGTFASKLSSSPQSRSHSQFSL